MSAQTRPPAQAGESGSSNADQHASRDAAPAADQPAILETSRTATHSAAGRLHRFANGLDTLFRVALGLAFMVLIIAVTVQVLGRSVFNASPVWTEELTRFALLYLAACGVGLAFRNGDLVNVDLISEALPPRARWCCRMIAAVATAALAATLLIPAWTYTAIGVRQTSPATGIRMDLVHASMLVLLASLCLFACIRVIGLLVGGPEAVPVRPEEPADP